MVQVTSTFHYTYVLIQPQSTPHSIRSINYVILTRRLVCMLLVTPPHGVTLIHHLGHHTPPILCRNPDHLSTSRSAIVPPGWQGDNTLRVAMVLLITLRRASTVPAFAKVIVCEFGRCGGCNPRGASVGGIGYSPARKSAGGLTVRAAWRGWWWGLTNVSPDVWIIITFTTDAYELTLTIVKGLTWATTGGYSKCKEWEGENVGEKTQRC